jgi:tRNA dimethylallyltransferase
MSENAEKKDAGILPLSTLLVITGATASGKTAYAIARAQALDAEIISCDSTLVYRGMDIGTAKPTAEERAAVPHHCMDLIGPDCEFSISDYIQAAAAAIREIRGRGKRILIVGGSGFYLKAFYRAVTDTIPVPPEVSEQVRELAATGAEALEKALLPFAPGKPDFLDWKNPRRVAKALERCLASGRPLAEIHAQFKDARGVFDAERKHTVLLEREPAELAVRIEQRVRAMLASGLVEEVRELRDSGKLRVGFPAAQAVGYRETLAWLNSGGTDEEALVASIALSTRQLVSKQRKWFRSQIPVDEVLRLP